MLAEQILVVGGRTAVPISMPPNAPWIPERKVPPTQEAGSPVLADVCADRLYNAGLCRTGIRGRNHSEGL